MDSRLSGLSGPVLRLSPASVRQVDVRPSDSHCQDRCP